MRSYKLRITGWDVFKKVTRMQGLLVLVTFVLVGIISHLIGRKLSSIIHRDMISTENPYPYARGYALLIAAAIAGLLLLVIP